MRLNDSVSHLVAVNEDWQPFLSNPRMVRAGNEITWSGRKVLMLSSPVTLDDLLSLEIERQYSFQVAKDGSIFQLYYLFSSDGVTVESASLSFYKVPDEQDTSVPWLRIDFDPLAERGPTHASCHLHSSLYPLTRIPIAGVPGPARFVDLVIAWFYPDEHAARRGVDGDGELHRTAGLLRVVSESLACGSLAKSISSCTHLRLPGDYEY